MCVDGNCLPTLHPCARYTCVTTTFPSELLVQSIRNFTGEALIELQEMNLWGKKHLHWPCKTTCCWSFLRSKMAPHKFWSKYFLIKHHQLQFGMDIYIYIFQKRSICISWMFCCLLRLITNQNLEGFQPPKSQAPKHEQTPWGGVCRCLLTKFGACLVCLFEENDVHPTKQLLAIHPFSNISI